jgi:hypothetical protein
MELGRAMTHVIAQSDVNSHPVVASEFREQEVHLLKKGLGCLIDQFSVLKEASNNSESTTSGQVR